MPPRGRPDATPRPARRALGARPRRQEAQARTFLWTRFLGWKIGRAGRQEEREEVSGCSRLRGAWARARGADLPSPRGGAGAQPSRPPGAPPPKCARARTRRLHCSPTAGAQRAVPGRPAQGRHRGAQRRASLAPRLALARPSGRAGQVELVEMERTARPTSSDPTRAAPRAAGSLGSENGRSRLAARPARTRPPRRRSGTRRPAAGPPGGGSEGGRAQHPGAGQRGPRGGMAASQRRGRVLGSRDSRDAVRGGEGRWKRTDPGLAEGTRGHPTRRVPQPRPHLRGGHAPAEPLAAGAARQASPRVPPPAPSSVSLRGALAPAPLSPVPAVDRGAPPARPLPARGRPARLWADHAPPAPAAGPAALPAGGRPRLRPPPRGECPPDHPESWQLGVEWGRRETGCGCARRGEGSQGSEHGVSPPGSASDRAWARGEWSRAHRVPHRTARSPLRAPSGTPAEGGGWERAPHSPSVLGLRVRVEWGAQLGPWPIAMGGLVDGGWKGGCVCAVPM